MKILAVFLLSIMPLYSEEIIPFTLEIAESVDQRNWGLMGRSWLPENQGMLFKDVLGSLWMFNVKIDLSVAFLDKNGTIISINELKSYPEMMDPNRPVLSMNDMWKYSNKDPIYRFFVLKALPAPHLTSFALEMNGGWFSKHHIRSGDSVIWQEDSSDGYIHKH